MTERTLVQVRLSRDLVKQVDHLKIEWGLTRGQAMERLLKEAIVVLNVVK